MSKITVYDSPKVTLWFHPEEKIVHHCVHKFIYGEEFHDFLLKGTELMKNHGAKKWLSNDKSNTVLRQDDIEWGEVNWFPQTVAAGWKFWAIVQPEAAVAQMNMDDLAKHYAEAGVIAKFFTSEDDAWHWLVSQ